MKKLYTMPEIEIKAFSTEDIITASSNTTTTVNGLTVNSTIINVNDIGSGSTINLPE